MDALKLYKTTFLSWINFVSFVKLPQISTDQQLWNNEKSI